jgi:hypothetical protein
MTLTTAYSINSIIIVDYSICLIDSLHSYYNSQM